MTHKSHLARCATLAIAASLALGSTQLLAQEAAAPPAPAPVIVVPDVAPPAPAPAPAIVVPDVAPQAAAPEAAPARPARATPRAAAQPRATAPRPAQAAAPAPAPVADTTVTDTEPADVAPVAAAPVEPAAAPEPVTLPEARDTTNTMAIILGVLAALVLIVIGFFALRRKGPKRYAAEPREEYSEQAWEPVEPAAALPENTAAPEFPAGLHPTQPSVAYSTAAFAAPKPAASGNLSHSGAAVALPRELPRTYEEREALMQRMVDAPPDRANPFRSKRARMKRARLILASLGRDFKHGDPWIDLSQYPSNWPELARRQSAAA